MPVTFRVCSGNVNFERVSQMLTDPDFIKEFTDGQENELQEEEKEEVKEVTKSGTVIDMDTKNMID